jgi:hypothetical protein
MITTAASRLTSNEERLLGRFVSADMSVDDMDLANLQRYFEGQSSSGPLWQRASYASDASLKRIIREARAVAQERADMRKVLGR